MHARVDVYAGNAYFPLTPLIAKSDSNETAKNLGPHFHWITETPMIKEFKQFRPWSNIMAVLEENMPTAIAQ